MLGILETNKVGRIVSNRVQCEVERVEITESNERLNMKGIEREES